MTQEERQAEIERIECCHINAKEWLPIIKLLSLIVASVIVFKYFING